MKEEMNKEQAVNVLNQVIDQFKATRAEFLIIQEALNFLVNQKICECPVEDPKE